MGSSIRGEDCDSGGLDTADCDSDCTVSECGDGHVNAAAGEQCEGDFSSGCSDDCRFSEARINEARDGWQELPKVAVAEDGDFVVLWTHYPIDATVPSSHRARVFSRSGQPVTQEFDAAPGLNALGDAALAVFSDGRFGLAITGWSNGEFHLQTYAAQATTPSTTSSVSAVPASPDHFFSDADMAARRDGSYVVVWAWDDDSGFRNDCYVRLFDDQGLPIGPVRP